MILESFPLSSPLCKHIESVIYYKDYVTVHNVERIIPTGNVFILIELDGFERSTFDANLMPNARYKNSWVSGIQRTYLNISVHQNSEMMIVKFKSMGAYPFFKFPICQLNNKINDSTTYFGDSILRLREDLISGFSSQEKFTMLERWLLQLLDSKKSPPQEILDIIEKLHESPFTRHKHVIQQYTKTKKI